MWSEDERRPALELIEAGVCDREVARRTGIARSTVGYWRRNPDRHRRFQSGDPSWRPQRPDAYCYALGLYLGDGHIIRQGASAWLRITLDGSHPGIAREAQDALSRVFPTSRVTCHSNGRAGKIDLQLSNASLPYAFPQGGPGHKHHRPIVLVDWQRELSRAHPGHLIRGLVHSDGCRTINRFSTKLPSGRMSTYEYPRYFFSNLSADIRGIFCDHCDLLGIRWTLSNPRNVSVACRDSVALLDLLVGPKS